MVRVAVWEVHLLTNGLSLGGDPKELIAVGTNAMATSAMMKAGAVKAATGGKSSSCQYVRS